MHKIANFLFFYFKIIINLRKYNIINHHNLYQLFNHLIIKSFIFYI